MIGYVTSRKWDLSAIVLPSKEVGWFEYRKCKVECGILALPPYIESLVSFRSIVEEVAQEQRSDQRSFANVSI